MSEVDLSFEHSALELRREFDHSFARSTDIADVQTEDFLAVRLGRDPYALALREIAGLYADRRVSPMPSAMTELLGIAGFRGAILPVYDLRTLLGYPASEPPRWLTVCALKPISFAFDAFDGHLRLERSAIAAYADTGREHVREIARGTDARPIIRLASVIETVERRARDVNRNKER